ncbi:MAG: hypothetical protein BJ554DRAFT_1950, partial [Olpidium bornovanus]
SENCNHGGKVVQNAVEKSSKNPWSSSEKSWAPCSERERAREREEDRSAINQLAQLVQQLVLQVGTVGAVQQAVPPPPSAMSQPQIQAEIAQKKENFLDDEDAISVAPSQISRTVSRSGVETQRKQVSYSMIKPLLTQVLVYDRHGGATTLETFISKFDAYHHHRDGLVPEDLQLQQAVAKLKKLASAFWLSHEKKHPIGDPDRWSSWEQLRQMFQPCSTAISTRLMRFYMQLPDTNDQDKTWITTFKQGLPDAIKEKYLYLAYKPLTLQATHDAAVNRPRRDHQVLSATNAAPAIRAPVRPTQNAQPDAEAHAAIALLTTSHAHVQATTSADENTKDPVNVDSCASEHMCAVARPSNRPLTDATEGGRRAKGGGRRTAGEGQRAKGRRRAEAAAGSKAGQLPNPGADQ